MTERPESVTGFFDWLSRDAHDCPNKVAVRSLDQGRDGGVNISLLEIDNVVLQMAGVADFATVGVFDDLYGEQVMIYVQAKNSAGLTPAAVTEHCCTHLADFKLPGDVIFRAELPKTARRKMDRHALAAEWTAAQRAS